MNEVEDAAQEPEEAPAPETLHDCPVTYSAGQRVVHVPRERYLEVMRALYDEGFAMCADITAADYLANPNRKLPDGVVGERFEVVVNLLSLTRRERIRVRTQVPADDPSIPSLFDIWSGTNFSEREIYDLMGITFTDHPDLTRILMPDDWEGHPLRKDHPIGRVPVQFKNPVTQQDVDGKHHSEQLA